MLLTGRFAEAATCIDQALQRGISANPDEAMETAVLQRFLLFLEQGGHEEFRAPPERLEADRPDDKIYPSLLARLDCELRHEQQAQARLDVLSRDNFGAVQRDHQWLLTIVLLADVAAMVGNTEQVKTLYDLLDPYSALVAGGEHIRFGSVSRYLGLLAFASPDSTRQPLPSERSGSERPDRGTPRPMHSDRDDRRQI